MSDTVDVYNQEQITAALQQLIQSVNNNKISIDLLRQHLGLSGTNTGDNAINTRYEGLESNATHTGDVIGSTALTIANNAVTTAKIANNAVTTAKIANNAVTTDKIANVDWAKVTGEPAYTTRWPAWSEVTSKPTTFVPSTHNHTNDALYPATVSASNTISAGQGLKSHNHAGGLYVPLVTPVALYTNATGVTSRAIYAAGMGISTYAVGVIIKMKYYGDALGKLGAVGPDSGYPYDIVSHCMVTSEQNEITGICRTGSNGDIYYTTTSSSNKLSLTVLGFFV